MYRFFQLWPLNFGCDANCDLALSPILLSQFGMNPKTELYSSRFWVDPKLLKNGDRFCGDKLCRSYPKMYIVWFTVLSFVIGKFCNVSKDYRLRIGGVPDKNIVLRQTVWSCVINQTIVFWSCGIWKDTHNAKERRGYIFPCGDPTTARSRQSARICQSAIFCQSNISVVQDIILWYIILSSKYMIPEIYTIFLPE